MNRTDKEKILQNFEHQIKEITKTWNKIIDSLQPSIKAIQKFLGQFNWHFEPTHGKNYLYGRNNNWKKGRGIKRRIDHIDLD